MTDLFSNFGLAFGIVFGSLMALCGLVLVVVGYSTLWSWLSSARWRKVTAQVVSSELVQERHFEDDLFFKPKISYTYSASGEQLTGQRIAFAEKLYPKEAAARRLLERFPVGMPVSCYVDPDDPTSVVLIRRGGIGGLVIGLLGLLMVAGPLYGALQSGLPIGWIKLAGITLSGLVCVATLLAWCTRRKKQRAIAAQIYPSPGRGNDGDIVRLVQQGERLLAIKLYRELHDTDLKSSRIAVDQLVQDAGNKPQL